MNNPAFFPKKTGAAPLAIALAMFILALTGCPVDGGGGGGGGGITPETPETSVIQNKDISQPAVTAGLYMSGWYTNSKNVEVPCYWKIDGQNYKRYDLTDGTLNAVADGITARGRVLYILGSERDTPYYSNKVVKHAPVCYWKNGTKIKINDNWQFPGTNIAVSESGDVYVVFTASRYCWKNGAYFELHDSDSTVLSDVFISGNDVYIAGCMEEGDKKLTAYWKNGVRTTVFSVPNSTASDLKSGKLFVLANKVYLPFNQVHYIQDPPGSNNVLGIDHWEPYLWQDDHFTPLAYDTSGSTSSVYVTESGDVYAAGINNGKLYYWKNGVKKDISVPERLSSPIDISVWKGDVYIAGANYIGNGRYRPCYIKISENGAETLNYLSATDGRATGIAQVQ